MIKSGRPQKQAIAASLANARRHPRQSGGTAPADALDFTGQYNTPLAEKEEGQFQDWLKRSSETAGRDLSHDLYDYDLRGQFKGTRGAPIEPGHGVDTYKKPNHPTFSDESQYHGAEHNGGHWGEGTFTPGRTNIEKHGLEGLKAYFDEREPDVKLISGGSLAPSKKALGGPTMPLPSATPSIPYAARQSARELYHPGGLIDSPIAGRTDRIPMSVAANSYVIPADVVSGGGAQGNTLAGARVLDHAFKSGPYGTALGKQQGGGRGIPRGGGRSPPPPYHPNTTKGGFAAGGVPHGMKDAVKIIAAGGEYVVPPHVVQHHPMLGNGDMKRGHNALDAYVKHVRKLTKKTLGKLPGPKRD